jgi:hypothetical protein
MFRRTNASTRTTSTKDASVPTLVILLFLMSLLLPGCQRQETPGSPPLHLPPGLTPLPTDSLSSPTAANPVAPNTVRIKASGPTFSDDAGTSRVAYAWTITGDRKWAGVSMGSPASGTARLSAQHGAITWKISVMMTARDDGDRMVIREAVEAAPVDNRSGEPGAEFLRRETAPGVTIRIGQEKDLKQGSPVGDDASVNGLRVKKTLLRYFERLLLPGEKTLPLPVNAPLVEVGGRTTVLKIDR